MNLANLFKTFATELVYGHKASEQRYIRWLGSQGMRIGEHVHIYSPWTVKVDTQRPWMIEIGDYVKIAADCSILQHDYSWSVLQHMTGEVLGSCGKVHIGNNVFLGQRVLVLKGAFIEDNVIIGAGSVVSGHLLSGSIYAGVPAQRLMSIQDFYKKRQSHQLQEAVDLVNEYQKVYGEQPPLHLLREFFWLFEPRDVEKLDSVFKAVPNLDDQIVDSSGAFQQSKPVFDSYDQFLHYCKSVCENKG